MAKKADENISFDFIVTSIGACVAQPIEKKKPPYLVIAYMTGLENTDVSFVLAPFPAKNKAFTVEDILSAIKTAEGVDNITYHNSDGCKKDVYICRFSNGKVIDVIARNHDTNRYENGVAEIYSAGVRFSIADEDKIVWKAGKKWTCNISFSTDCKYAKDTYEYALINAYNACLLGRIFERDELQIETRDRKRVRFEVRKGTSTFVDEEMLYIHPVFRDDLEQVIDYYVTEEFNYIDGENVSCRSYKIAYSNRMNNYNLMRL